MAQQSHHLKCSVSMNTPKEPKQWGRQTAQQQAAKCCFTHQQCKHVVPLSIKTHSYSSCHLLLLEKLFTGTCGNIHVDIPSRRGFPYHDGDMLSFAGWTAVPEAWWSPWTASSQKLTELQTTFPKCTTSSCLHPFAAWLLFLQYQQHPYTPAASSQAPLTALSLSHRKGTTTSVQGRRTDRRKKHIKCLLQSRKRVELQFTSEDFLAS